MLRPLPHQDSCRRGLEGGFRVSGQSLSLGESGKDQDGDESARQGRQGTPARQRRQQAYPFIGSPERVGLRGLHSREALKAVKGCSVWGNRVSGIGQRRWYRRVPGIVTRTVYRRAVR